MKNLCIIPARGGSKRIQKKNIKSFLGKPIIAYSIEAALQSKLFDAVMVSTDDIEIAEIAKEHGAQVPFFRSDDNADDYAVLAAVINEILSAYEKQGVDFDNICCILPTAPFVNAEKIRKAYQELQPKAVGSVIPILPFSFPIQRSFEIIDGKIEMVWKEHLNTRSQDLEPRYHDAGQFYWVKKEIFIAEGKLLTSNAKALLVSELEAQDIDNETDWKLAEMKYQLLHQEEN